MSHQDNLKLLVLRTEPVGKQAKILEGIIAEVLRFIDCDCDAMTFGPICDHAFELLDQFELAALVGCDAQLRQHDAHDLLEAEPGVGYAGKVKVREPAREDRVQQRGLAGAGLAGAAA